MPIEHGKGGGTMITGDAIKYARLCALKMAVGLEMKGIRVNRGPVIWKQVKKEFGIKGGKAAVHAWLCLTVEQERRLQCHIDKDGRKWVNGEEVQ